MAPAELTDLCQRPDTRRLRVQTSEPQTSILSTAPNRLPSLANSRSSEPLYLCWSQIFRKILTQNNVMWLLAKFPVSTEGSLNPLLKHHLFHSALNFLRQSVVCSCLGSKLQGRMLIHQAPNENSKTGKTWEPRTSSSSIDILDESGFATQ